MTHSRVYKIKIHYIHSLHCSPVTMADGKPITEFFKNAGKLGISSLVLAVLEKMMDINFVCPCQPVLNILLCVCYGVVPFILCFVFATSFVEVHVEGMQGSSKYKKEYYCLLIAFIWLFLFFFDGRYVACAFSHWGGEYTETTTIKWCKPKGDETEVLECQQETQKWIAISQVSLNYKQQKTHTKHIHYSLSVEDIINRIG